MLKKLVKRWFNITLLMNTNHHILLKIKSLAASAKSETTDKIIFWLTSLTLTEENNFWLRKLTLLIENFFYEVINLICYSFQRCYVILFATSSQATSSQNRRKQRRRNIVASNVVVNNAQKTSQTTLQVTSQITSQTTSQVTSQITL